MNLMSNGWKPIKNFDMNTLGTLVGTHWEHQEPKKFNITHPPQNESKIQINKIKIK
jgi:hypothetical protein